MTHSSSISSSTATSSSLRKRKYGNDEIPENTKEQQKPQQQQLLRKTKRVRSNSASYLSSDDEGAFVTATDIEKRMRAMFANDNPKTKVPTALSLSCVSVCVFRHSCHPSQLILLPFPFPPLPYSPSS